MKEKRNYTVYCHTNKINNKKYVGITYQSVKKRWASGFGYQTQELMWRAIKKYGWKQFEHEILFDNLTKKEACDKEIELIAKWDLTNRKFGYNLTSGGNHFEHNEESKKKISEASKGRKFSKETRKKLSESLRGKKHFAGCHHSEEAKKKIGIASKLRNTGKYPSEETRRKMSESLKEMHKNMPKEKKEKIKEAVRISHEKTVLCVDTNEIFSSIREATEKTGASHIGEVCNGNRKKSGGFYWRFI